MESIAEKEAVLGSMAKMHVASFSPFLNEESKRSTDLFGKMAERWFFTVDSQEGRTIAAGEDEALFPAAMAGAIDDAISSECLDGEWKDVLRAKYLLRGGSYGRLEVPCVYSERAYVCGIMPAPLAHLFVTVLNRTDKFTAGRTPVTYGHSNTYDTNPDAPFLDNCMRGHVGACSWVGTPYRDDVAKHFGEELLGGPDMRALKERMDAFTAFEYVECVDPLHGRDAHGPDGLFTDVLRALDAAHAMYRRDPEGFWRSARQGL